MEKSKIIKLFYCVLFIVNFMTVKAQFFIDHTEQSLLNVINKHGITYVVQFDKSDTNKKHYSMHMSNYMNVLVTIDIKENIVVYEHQHPKSALGAEKVLNNFKDNNYNYIMTAYGGKHYSKSTYNYDIEVYSQINKETGFTDIAYTYNKKY
jgi:hypothetical protein